MALTANSLTTWAKLKDELGLTDDTLQARGEGYIAEVSEELERLCNRVFRRAAGHVEAVAPGDFRLAVSRPPIISVASITENGTAVDATDYEVQDAEAGLILREDGWTREDLGYEGGQLLQKATVEVTYAGGYVLPGTAWSTNTFVLSGAFVRPTSASNQNVFQAGGDGTTGGPEPTWPGTVGATVVDGGVTWTNVGPRTLPRGLERIAINGAVQLWRGRGRPRGIRQESVGAASRTYANDAAHPFFSPEDLLALELYRRPVTV